MKPTPEQFLMGEPYTVNQKRHRFVRPKPYGRPRIEVRQLPAGDLIEQTAVSTRGALDYLNAL